MSLAEWFRNLRSPRTLADVETLHNNAVYDGPDTVPGTYWVRVPGGPRYLLEGERGMPASRVLDVIDQA